MRGCLDSSSAHARPAGAWRAWRPATGVCGRVEGVEKYSLAPERARPPAQQAPQTASRRVANGLHITPCREWRAKLPVAPPLAPPSAQQVRGEAEKAPPQGCAVRVLSQRDQRRRAPEPPPLPTSSRHTRCTLRNEPPPALTCLSAARPTCRPTSGSPPPPAAPPCGPAPPPCILARRARAARPLRVERAAPCAAPRLARAGAAARAQVCAARGCWTLPDCWTVHMLTRLSSGARCAIAERAWCSRGGEGGGVPGGWAAGRHGEGDQGSRGRGAAQEGQGAGGRCVARSLARSRHVRADTWPSSGASGRERRQGRGAGVCGLREALGQAMQQVQGRLLLRRQVPGTTGTSHAAAQRSLRVPTPRHADA